MALALSFSSTIIILKLLSDRKEQNRLYGKITIGILLVQDIVAAFALVMATARSEGVFSVSAIGDTGRKGVLVGVPLYLAATYILPKWTKLLPVARSFYSYSLLAGIRYCRTIPTPWVFTWSWALIAGVALATLPILKKLPRGYVRSAIFRRYILYCARHSAFFNNFGSLWLPVLVFSIIVMVLKPLVVMTIMGVLGYTRNTSFKTSGALAQISEFSLVFVILGSRQGIIRADIVNIITIVALITIATSSYAITYSNQIYNLLEKTTRYVWTPKNT